MEGKMPTEILGVKAMRANNGWENWSKSEWNSALTQHLFARRQGNAQPVVRIPITSETLARVANASQNWSSEVRGRFIQLYREMPPSKVKKLFEVPYAFAGWTPVQPAIPPFIADLVLTLLVASASDQTYTEGNFRSRMALEIGHAQSAFYPLHGLSALWESLSEWLEHRVRCGDVYRLLILPDKGREVRIGYSKRLAFPNFRDYLRLASLLSREVLDSDSPPTQILRHVLTESAYFSSGFLAELKDFESLLLSGRPDLFSHPFWAAVRSITWEFQDPDSGGSSCPRYRLLLDWLDPSRPAIHLLGSRLCEPERVQAKALPYPVSSYTHMIPFATDREEAISNPLGSLVNLAVDDRFTCLSTAPALRAIKNGAVCFAPEETGEWLSQSSLPSGSEVFVSIHRVLRADFLDGLRKEDVCIKIDAPIAEGDWSILGRIPTDVLLALASQGIPPFANIDWIAKRIETPEIRLHGTPQNERYYFFRRGLAPTMSCRGSDTITFTQAVSEHNLGEFPLSPMSSEVYAISPSHLERLPPRAEIDFRAYSGGKLLTTRTVAITQIVSNIDFKLPSNPKAWLVENSRGHLTACNVLEPFIQAFPEQTLNEKNRPVVSRSFKLVRSAVSASRCSPITWQPLASIPREASDLLECIAALGSARQGIAAEDLHGILQATVRPPSYLLAWDIIQSLLENGFLNKLVFRRWHGMRFFPQNPVFYVIERDEEILVRAIGVFPELMRAELQRECLALGLRPQLPFLPGALSIGPIRIQASERHQCDALSERMGVPIKDVDEASFQPTPDLNQILATREEVLEDIVGEKDVSVWDWIHCRFEQFSHRSSGLISIERRRWGDRPDEYVLKEARDRIVWNTRSRNWALLVGYALAHPPVFSLLSNGILQKTLEAGPYLPLQLARAFVLIGEGFSGPGLDNDGKPFYAYALGFGPTQSRLCSSLLEPCGNASLQRFAPLHRWRALMPERPYFHSARIPRTSTKIGGKQRLNR
jgi:hypothetical protein